MIYFVDDLPAVPPKYSVTFGLRSQKIEHYVLPDSFGTSMFLLPTYEGDPSQLAYEEAILASLGYGKD